MHVNLTFPAQRVFGLLPHYKPFYHESKDVPLHCLFLGFVKDVAPPSASHRRIALSSVAENEREQVDPRWVVHYSIYFVAKHPMPAGRFSHLKSELQWQGGSGRG